jgi:hypothetical protein
MISPRRDRKSANEDWTTQISLNPLTKLAFPRTCFSRAHHKLKSGDYKLAATHILRRYLPRAP